MADYTKLLEEHEPLVRRGMKCPYVVFGKEVTVYRDGKPGKVKEPVLFTLDLSGCHCNLPTIDSYVHKGWKVLKWWFPRPQSQFLMEQQDTEQLAEQYLSVDKHLRILTGQFDKELREEREKVSVLQKRIDELTAKQKAAANAK